MTSRRNWSKWSEEDIFALVTTVKEVEEAAVARNVILHGRSFWSAVEAAAKAQNVLPDRSVSSLERHYYKFVANLEKLKS